MYARFRSFHFDIETILLALRQLIHLLEHRLCYNRRGPISLLLFSTATWRHRLLFESFIHVVEVIFGTIMLDWLRI